MSPGATPSRQQGQPRSQFRPAPRVLVVSHVGGLRGGAERSLVSAAEGLVRSGRFEPVAVVPRPGELADALKNMDIPVIETPIGWWARVGNIASWGYGRSGARSWGRELARIAQATKQLGEIVDRWGTSAVITDTSVAPVGAFAARRSRLPHVWWVHEYDEPHYLLGHRLTFRLIDRLSHTVVVNSMSTRQQLEPLVRPERIQVIEPICSTPTGSPVQGDQGEPLRVLVLGRLAPFKRPEDVVRAAHAAREVGVAVQVRFAGATGDRQYAESLDRLVRELGLNEVVDFVGHVDPPTAQIDWAHVGVLPSEKESFGRTMLEFMRRGRPVVASDAGGPALLLSHGENSLLYEPCSVPALADHLIALHTDRSRLVRMGQRALEFARSRNTSEAQTDLLEGLLDQVIGTADYR